MLPAVSMGVNVGTAEVHGCAKMRLRHITTGRWRRHMAAKPVDVTVWHDYT